MIPLAMGPPREPPPSSAPAMVRVVKFRRAGSHFAVVTVPLVHDASFAGFTPAELEVAALVAEGLTNRAIAHCRGTAERTVANQMASLLRKGRLQSRYELAARMALHAANKVKT